jgi:uncharacterized membrane protein
MLPRGLIGDIKPENWLGMIDALYAIILTLLLIELPTQILDVIKEYELHPNLHSIILSSLGLSLFGYASLFILLYDIWAHHRLIISNSVLSRLNLSLGIIILFLCSLLPPLYHVVSQLKRDLLTRENSSIGAFSFIYWDARFALFLTIACTYGCIALIAAKDIRFLRLRGSEADSRMIVLKRLKSSGFAMVFIIVFVGILSLAGYIPPPFPILSIALCTHLPVDKLMIQLKQRILGR